MYQVLWNVVGVRLHSPPVLGTKYCLAFVLISSRLVQLTSLINVSPEKTGNTWIPRYIYVSIPYFPGGCTECVRRKIPSDQPMWSVWSRKLLESPRNSELLSTLELRAIPSQACSYDRGSAFCPKHLDWRNSSLEVLSGCPIHWWCTIHIMGLAPTPWECHSGK